MLRRARPCARRSGDRPRANHLRALLITLAAALTGCASTIPSREGASGPIAWRVEDIGVVRQQVDGKDADAYTFVLVVRETRGAPVQITRLEVFASDMAGHFNPGPNVQTGNWTLPANGQWRIPFPFTMRCIHVPGWCPTATTVAPFWNIRLVGTSERGQPVDVEIPVQLPPATIRTIFK